MRTVQPILHALKQADVADFAHVHVNDAQDLIRGLTRWGQKQHSRYRVGYVAMHGSPGAVHIGRRRVDLHAVAAEIPSGRLTSKVLHFGSCSVLQDRSERSELRAGFGVRAITGFTEDVDWFDSMAFELLLFDALTRYKRIDAAENYLKKNHRQLANRLGFVVTRR